MIFWTFTWITWFVFERRLQRKRIEKRNVMLVDKYNTWKSELHWDILYCLIFFKNGKLVKIKKSRKAPSAHLSALLRRSLTSAPQLPVCCHRDSNIRSWGKKNTCGTALELQVILWKLVKGYWEWASLTITWVTCVRAQPPGLQGGGGGARMLMFLVSTLNPLTLFLSLPVSVHGVHKIKAETFDVNLLEGVMNAVHICNSVKHVAYVGDVTPQDSLTSGEKEQKSVRHLWLLRPTELSAC